MHRRLGSISRLPLLLSAALILVSMSNSPPLPPASLSPIFCGSSSFNIYMFPISLITFLHKLVSIPKSPHPVPLSSFRHSFFGPKTSPCVSQQFFVCTFMYLHLVSMSRLHPSCLNNNFFRSSGFNIELSLPPMCLSISRVHFASYANFPPLASPPFLTFLLFQYLNCPCTNNFLHASCLNV